MMSYPYPPGEGRVRWVSPGWLMDHLGEVMVLDVQPNVHDYIMGHIPGAIYLNEGLFRSSQNSLPAVYVSQDAIRPILSSCGLEPDRAVVVYSGAGRYSRCTAGIGDGLEQTMAAYSLVRFGHNRVYILDGGIEGWRVAGGGLTKEIPRWGRSGFDPQLRSEYFVEYDEFVRMKDRDDVVVLDARPHDSYRDGGLWIKRGHIPGALNLPWRSLMAEENPRLMRSREELLRITGWIDPHGKTIIVYCGTGREATCEFLILKFYLGYERVRIYEGSFTEWASHPENPTVMGESPR